MPAISVFRIVLPALALAATLFRPVPAGALDLIDRLLSGAGTGNAATRAADASSKDATPFRVGLLLPVNRDWRGAAESVARGWAVAIRMGDGFVADRPIDVVSADTDADPETAVAAARALSSGDGIDVFAGVLSPAAARALSDFARQEKRALAIAGAFEESAQVGGCSPYVARTSFRPQDYQRTAGRYLAGKHRTAMTIAPDEPGGREGVGRFLDGFRAGGGRVLEQVWTPRGERYNFAGWLSRARISGPRMIYAIYSGRAAQAVIHEYARTGLEGAVPLMGPAWLYGPETLTRRPGKSEGQQFLATHLPSLDEAANRLFVAAYRKAYGEAPDLYAFLGYENALAVLLTAAELHGRPHDTARFIATMRKLSYDGIMPRGDFAFDATGTARLNRLFWTEIRGTGDGGLAYARLETIDVPASSPVCSQTG